MRSSAEGVVWPPVAFGPAATFATMMHYLEASQWFPPAAIAQRQGAQLAVLVDHAAKHSPFFRQRLEKAGIQPASIRSLGDLQRLPILTRTDVQQAGDTLHCTEIPKSHLPTSEGKSSGSTGEPVTVKKTSINNLFWQANMMREHFWHKRDFNDRLMVIRSGIKAPTHQRGWGNPVDILFSSGATMGLPILSDVRDIAKAILEFKPAQLNIYPSTLDGLIGYCQKEGITIEGVKHIWSISETLSPEQRKKAADFFKASVEDDYSSNELGVIALQCPASGLYHVMAESVVVETVDEEGNPCGAGEVGRVLVTCLNNLATPLIRYDIGDYAELGTPCSCGRGLPVIKAIKGRKRNLVIKPDGSRHWPPMTVAVFRSELPIHQFQLIQHALDDIEVRLVMDHKLTPEEEVTLTDQLHKTLDHPFPLRFVYFEGRLPLPPNGKFEDFICRI